MTRYHIVLLGPPGAGKGTQARRIVDRYNYRQLATGDILRQEAAMDTPEGHVLRKTMRQGELVSDDVILSLIKNNLVSQGNQNRFLFDGFPRTLTQATGLDKILSEINQQLLSVIEFIIEPSLLTARITGRLMCGSCGESYHRTVNPPKNDGICDNCGEKLAERHDDDAQTLIKRLAVYEQETSPLSEYYHRQGLLHKIDATLPIKEITSLIDDHITKVCILANINEAKRL